MLHVDPTSIVLDLQFAALRPNCNLMGRRIRELVSFYKRTEYTCIREQLGIARPLPLSRILWYRRTLLSTSQCWPLRTTNTVRAGQTDKVKASNAAEGWSLSAASIIRPCKDALTIEAWHAATPCSPDQRLVVASCELQGSAKALRAMIVG